MQKEMDLAENLQDSEDEVTSEAIIYSFIVRVCREELVTKKRQIVWRGFVSSVSNGERFYFIDIKKIPALIVAHIKQLQ